jgi:hypothetical protein
MRRGTFLAVLVALVATSAPVRATEWFVVGGGGGVGDCMMEWRLVLAPPRNDPAPPEAPGDNRPSPYVALGLAPDGPEIGKTQGDPPMTRLKATQWCRDGDPTCDADGTINNRCQFRLGMCFCVDDPNMNTAGSRKDCWQRRQDICNDGAGFASVIGRYLLTTTAEPAGVYLTSPTGRNGKRWNDRTLENAEQAMLDAGAVPAPTLDLGKSLKFRLAADPVPPQSLLSETGVDKHPSSWFFYPKRAPSILTPRACTKLVDVHVPLVANYDRQKRLTKFTQGQMELKTFFVPDEVDVGGDKIQLNCLPSAPLVNCTGSLSRIDPGKTDAGPTNYDYCWDAKPPAQYPLCAPPTTNVTSCDDYFPGCKVQDRWPGTPPGC